MSRIHRPALAHLKRVDPVLGGVIERVGPCRLEARRAGTHYDALVRSIVFQQLSGKAADRSLPLAHLGRLPDDAIIEHLVQVKGIGRWTVQMFLMFRLGRPDVLPELDLGVQNAIQRAYGLKKRPTPKDVLRIGEKWRPYASIASWYLWRSLENGDGQA